jgi:hypothetical protein
LDTPTSPRDEKGRFQPGCAPGPGRPRGRSNLLQRAAEEAITPEHVAAILRRALRSALEGNLNAAKFVMDRACGKSPEAKGGAEPLGVALPNLKTVEACAAAIDKIGAAITAGAIESGEAKLLLELVQTRLKATRSGTWRRGWRSWSGWRRAST